MNRPNDERHFLHKKIFGAISTISGLLPIPGGNIISSVTRRLAGGRGQIAGPRQCLPGDPRCPERIFPGSQSFAGGGRSRQTKVPGLRGFAERLIPGGATGFEDEFEDFGDAVIGQYGAALEPGSRSAVTLLCPRGTVLGLDDLCYNKRDLKKDERKWPPGTKPLLTGGEMRCIRIASGAAKKLATKEKQLRRMGMLKALPRARASKATPPVRALPAGTTIVQN